MAYDLASSRALAVKASAGSLNDLSLFLNGLVDGNVTQSATAITALTATTGTVTNLTSTTAAIAAAGSLTLGAGATLSVPTDAVFVDLAGRLIYRRDTTVTAAEGQALNATVKELVPAPGAGRFLWPVTFVASINVAGYTGAGTAFGGIAAGEDLTVWYGDGAGTAATTSLWATVETTGFLDQTTEQIRAVEAALTVSAVANFTPLANRNLVLNNSGAITLGSSFRVTTFYRIITV